MRASILIAAVCLTLVGCDLFFTDDGNQTEPRYNARIAWDSGLYSNYLRSHTVHDGSVFFYERPPGEENVDIYTLTKINAQTGKLIWRSDVIFQWIVLSQPVIIGNHVYVFLLPNVILGFDRETGEHTATVRLDIDGRNWEMNMNVVGHGEHLYMGMFLTEARNCYFVRLNVSTIDHNNEPEAPQTMKPEILWEPETRNPVTAMPVLYDGVVFTSTFAPGGLDPVEIAGFCVNTGGKRFHITFAGPDEDYDDNIMLPTERGTGIRGNPILIHDGILYFISTSISAWNISTGERLYRHVFTNDMPNTEVFGAGSVMQAVFHRGRIFYTSGHSHNPPNSFHNIHSIDAATGKLVWNTVAMNSESLNANPIIANGRLYIPQFFGLYVYDAMTGRLIGVDRSFSGVATVGRNILYGNLMITLKRVPTGVRLVAVNVGR
jgi:outer membrane protein assembly factor BamB